MQIIQTRETSFEELYNRYEEVNKVGLLRAKIQIPPHQRSKRWDSKKCARWIEHLKDAAKSTSQSVSGVVILYYLREDWNLLHAAGATPELLLTIPEKTNDGQQRTLTSINWYIRDCKAKIEKIDQNDKLTKEEKETKKAELDPFVLLRAVKIFVEHVIYESEEEAVKNYILTNSLGTLTTGLELAKGIWACRFKNDYKECENKLKRISDIIKNCMLAMGGEIDNYWISDDKKNKKTPHYHKRIRNDQSLFLRFITEDKTRQSYKSAKSNFLPEDLDKSDLLEFRLASKFIEFGLDDVEKKLINFETFIINQQAFLKQIWGECFGVGTKPANTWMRWWLDFAIHCKNNNFDKQDIRDFTKALVKTTRGKTTLLYKNSNGDDCHITTSTDGLGNLTTMVNNLPDISADRKNMFHLEVVKKARKKKKLNKPLLSKGFHNSHIKAYAIHGEGETLPENAIENCSRGAKDMEEKTIETLTQLHIQRNNP